MNKILSLLALPFVFASGVAVANTGAAPFDYSGFYGGFNMGAVSTTSAVSISGATLDGMGASGFSYGADAGVGFLFEGPWYVGAEFGIGNNSAELKLSDASFSGKLTQNFSYTANARLGRTFGETLVYGKLGYAYTQMKGAEEVGFGGLRMGGGVETRLADRFTGRAEGIYTAYGAESDSAGWRYEPASVGMVFGLNYYLQ